MNIARVFSQQQRLERAQNRSEARSKKALTEASDGFVGLDADKGPIEISFHDRCLEANDFQRRSLYLLISYLSQQRRIPTIRGRISFLIQKARPVYTPSGVVRRAVDLLLPNSSR